MLVLMVSSLGISVDVVLKLVFLVVAAIVIYLVTPKLPPIAQWVIYGVIVLVALLVVLQVLGFLN